MIIDGIIEVVRAFKVFVDEGSRIIKRLEEVTGLVVVPILFGLSRYVNARTVDSVYTVLRGLGSVDKLGVILFSSGGDIDEAYIIATQLQRIAKEKLVVYVPRYAKSAATLIALSGDEVVMLPVAELGPIDPVIYDRKSERYVPLQSILEILDILRHKEVSRDVVNAILDRIPVLELGDYKRAVEHNVDLCAKVLARRMLRSSPEKAREAAKRLAEFKQHEAAVTLVDAQELGLVVREAASEEADLLWKLHNL